MKTDTRSMACLLLATALLASGAHAAITYDTAGSTYSQNFDSPGGLADSGSSNAWNNDSTIEGWYWWNSSVTTPATYTASSTTTSTGNQILSLGKLSTDTTHVGATTDRAFGAQGLVGTTTTYGMQIRNTTGSTLGSFTLGYTGEEWRSINSESADNLILEYAVFAAGTTNQLATSSATGWTSIAALQFTTPTTGGSSTGRDGNVAANRTVFTPTSSTAPLNWTAGSDLWVRWRDVSGSQYAMGVDDVSFSASAVPEPSAALLGALGSLALLRRKR